MNSAWNCARLIAAARIDKGPAARACHEVCGIGKTARQLEQSADSCAFEWKSPILTGHEHCHDGVCCRHAGAAARQQNLTICCARSRLRKP